MILNMEIKMKLREFIEKYHNEGFNQLYWYDWFCDNEELNQRSESIVQILDGVDSDYILDNYYIHIKNIEITEEQYYDQIRVYPIDDSKQHELYFSIDIEDPRNNCRYSVYTARISGVEFQFNDLEKVHKFINSWGN